MKEKLFIAFEGIDGSGKSTQVRKLAARLEDEGHKVHQTFEPTNGTIGSLIRTILKGEKKADHRVIAGLFVADRLDHLLNEETGILNKLAEGHTVLCDRYCFSSYAYQGTHMSMDWVIDANAMSTSILRPHLNIFIDVDPQTSMQRIHQSRQSTELFESLDSLSLVRTKFFEAFEKLRHQEKVALIDGNRDEETITSDIYSLITAL